MLKHTPDGVPGWLFQLSPSCWHSRSEPPVPCMETTIVRAWRVVKSRPVDCIRESLQTSVVRSVIVSLIQERFDIAITQTDRPTDKQTDRYRHTHPINITGDNCSGIRTNCLLDLSTGEVFVNTNELSLHSNEKLLSEKRILPHSLLPSATERCAG